MQALGYELTAQQLDFIEKLKDAVYDVDDLLDEFATLAAQQEHLQNCKKVRRLLSRLEKFGAAYKMSQELKNIRKKLDDIANDANKYSFKVDYQPIRKREQTCSYVYEREIIGREDDKRKIVDMLLDSNVQRDISVLAIVGMGGLGKTALAQLVYNDPRIQKEFPLRFWVCVSDQDQSQFNAEAILAKIYKSTTPEVDNVDGLGLDLLVHKLREKLKQDKYLLVLDDVWTENHSDWIKLRRYLTALGQRENKIMVTTRSHGTAVAVGNNHPYKLLGLSDENSWNLFKMVIGREHVNCDDLAETGKDIVKKCANVPLAIKVIGSLLHGQPMSKWQTIQRSRLTEIKNNGNDIIPILKFSYYHLSPPLKSCFMLCSLFPKDFKIQKETLISLWMAHDYVEPLDEGQSIEEAAEEYFQILLRRCFFQDTEWSEIDGTLTFKIHDLLHDMAHQIVGKEIFRADSATISLDKRIYHLYDLNVVDRTRGFITSANKVRTYIKAMEPYCPLDESRFPMSELLINWRSLRALDLNSLDMQSLPDAIGKLLHLRYLNLSNSKLKMLPKSFTKLTNLKFLNLDRCPNLKQLPNDFSKLCNLRTLYVYSDEYFFGGREGLSYMPLGMGKLTCLTRLNKFIVAQRKRNLKQDVDGLESLRVFRDLKGHLDICISEDYKHVKESGGGGYLCNKQHLNSIMIEWACIPWNTEIAKESNAEELLEDFQPHSNLKKLNICRYHGLIMPKWARADNLATFLPNLVKISIHGCHGLSELPCLGKLHSLKTLIIFGLSNLEYMENATSSTTSNATRVVEMIESPSFFPSLEVLELGDLPKLKGWWRRSNVPRSGLGMGDDDVVSTDSSVQISSGDRLLWFPRLSQLDITRCPNLESIPLCPTVETLSLADFNENLQMMKKEEEGHEEKRCSNDFGHLRHDPKMRDITTDNVRHLKSLPMMTFQCLTNMRLYNLMVEDLSEVQEVFRSCSSLQFLELRHSNNLRSISGSLKYLTALKCLALQCLTELRFDGTDEDEEDSTSTLWKCLAQCLHSLILASLLKVVELPKGMRYLTAIQSLKIANLPLKDLPEWIGCLSSLHSLEILSCKCLKSLPQTLRDLTSLKRLKVGFCNQVLHERCKEPDGEDWPKIQHIPTVEID